MTSLHDLLHNTDPIVRQVCFDSCVYMAVEQFGIVCAHFVCEQDCSDYCLKNKLTMRRWNLLNKQSPIAPAVGAKYLFQSQHE